MSDKTSTLLRVRYDRSRASVRAASIRARCRVLERVVDYPYAAPGGFDELAVAHLCAPLVTRSR